MVMAEALFMTLKARTPSPEVDVVAPAWSLPLLARMPEVGEAVPMPLGHGEFGWGRRRALGRELRDRAYDQAIVLPRSFKSALVPFHAGIPVRTGYRGESRYWLVNDMRRLDKAALPRTVDRYVALGHPADGPRPPPVPEPALRVDPQNQARLRDELGLDEELPVVALMPGAEFGPAKCWPLEYFAAVATDARRRGRQVWVLGSDKDRPAGERIRTEAGAGVLNLCGRTRLEDAVDLLALAEAAVTNDSGLMHVAAAVGCHVVALYGSTTPEYTPPLTRRKDVLWLRPECGPCMQRECPLGHLKCLRDLRPEQATEALGRL
jgi:heptosyltransferase-2